MTCPPPHQSASAGGDDRGSSLTAMTAPVIMALFLVAGLVVDGTAQVRAHRRAEVVAAHAVRSGCDAGAARRLVGRDGSGAALRAARQVLDDEGLNGSASMHDGMLDVTTSTTVPTTFLALLGVEQLTASGAARGELHRI